MPYNYRFHPKGVTMSACENLPQELIAVIVDNIRDDTATLKTFSLVCRAWTNAARDHLFATLTIHDRCIGRMRNADFTSTYTPFLRHLHLFLPGQDPCWREVIPLLADFRTPRLRSLIVSALRWRSLLPSEQSAFISRFRSIVCLQLNIYLVNQLTDFATITCSLPHLEELILRPTGLRAPYAWEDPLPLSSLLRLPERLSTLDVFYDHRGYGYFLEWLCSIPEQLSIHTLYLTLDGLFPRDLEHINEFLKVLGTSLEVFQCWNYENCGMFRFPVPILELIKFSQTAMEIPVLT
jgi:hypothetical protein